MKKFSARLYSIAYGWLVLVLLALQVVFQVFFLNTQSGEMNAAGPIDLLFFYTPDTVYELVDIYGPGLRDQYRTFELTVDIAYPVVYTLLLSLAISWLFQRGLDFHSPLRNLNLVPFGAWFFDLLENLAIVGMLSVHPARPALLAWAATLFTMVKWLFALVSLLLILYGIAAVIRKSRA